MLSLKHASFLLQKESNLIRLRFSTTSLASSSSPSSSFWSSLSSPYFTCLDLEIPGDLGEWGVWGKWGVFQPPFEKLFLLLPVGIHLCLPLLSGNPGLLALLPAFCCTHIMDPLLWWSADLHAPHYILLAGTIHSDILWPILLQIQHSFVIILFTSTILPLLFPVISSARSSWFHWFQTSIQHPSIHLLFAHCPKKGRRRQNLKKKSY